MTLEVVEKRGFVRYIRSRGARKDENSKIIWNIMPKAGMDAFHSRLKRFRKICPRCEKTLNTFCGLLALAMGIIVFNRVANIHT